MKIIASRKDTAGINVCTYLDKNSFELVDEDIIYANPKSKEDVLIFASRHSAVSGIPQLTVHATGNFSKADFGGQEKKLSFCQANLMCLALRKLEEFNKTGFPVNLECTHHGPLTLMPCFFIEIGSTEKEWKNEKAQETLAEVLKFILNTKQKEKETVIGFGGQHYPKKFTELCLDGGYDFGHICPKHMAEHLDLNLAEQMIKNTFPKPSKAVIDKKSLKAHEREKVIFVLEQLKFNYEMI